VTSAKIELLAQAPLYGANSSYWSSIDLDPEGGHLYFGDRAGGRLYRMMLDGKTANGNGTKVEIITENVPAIEGLLYVS
jgi:hypothetical protein